MVSNASSAWALVLVVSLGTASAAEVEVRKKAKDLFEVSRQTAREAEIRERLRITPRHVQDEIDGFTLQELEDAPTLAALGFEPGDVVKSVDGRRLDSPETVLAIRRELVERIAPFSVTVELERGGATITRTIQVS